MKRNLAAELAEGFDALAVNRLSQGALPPPEVESMTPPSDLMEDLVAQATPTTEPPEKAERVPKDP